MWQERANRLVCDGRQLLSGTRQDSVSGQTFELVSPRDKQRFADVAACADDDVERAVRIARACFNAGTWSGVKPAELKPVLLRWADLVEQHRDELALLICIEMGKPIRDCVQVDLASVTRAIRWYAEAADKYPGTHPDTGIGSVALVAREPVGVVAVVSAWNFPLAAVGYEVAPALMLGNSVIVKPSERSPLSVLRCCELAVEAGLPGVALSVLPALGQTTGAALGRHSDVDVVSITGSAAAGRSFLRYSAESNCKRVWPELGGKSTVIVCDDAPDVGAAAKAIVWGAYFNQGQMCTGAARVLVHRQVRDQLLEAICQVLDRLILGDPLDWTTDVGPMVSPLATAEVLAAIAEGVSSGGTLLRGGNEVDVVSGGHYLAPSLIADASTSCELFTQEVFGPVATLLDFVNLDEALALATGPGFGMALSIWTASLDTAFKVSRKAKVGTVWINCFEADDLTVPAGGVKESGFGRTKSFAVLDKYSDLKTFWIELLQ